MLASAIADLLRSSHALGADGGNGGSGGAAAAETLTDLLPLAAICGSAPSEISTVLSQLRVCGVSKTTLRGMRRGCVGAALLPEDSALLQLTPLRVYARAEIIAWEDAGDTASGRAPGMRYGRIAAVGGIAGVTAPLEGKLDGAIPAAAPEHDFGGIRQIKVEVRAEHFTLLLSSEIYSFRASAGSAAAPSKQRDAAALAQPSAGGGAASATARSKAPSAGSAAASSVVTDESASIAPAGVDEEMLLAAVDGILKRAGLSLSAERKDLMQANLVLRERLAHAAAQLETSVRSSLACLSSWDFAFRLLGRANRRMMPGETFAHPSLSLRRLSLFFFSSLLFFPPRSLARSLSLLSAHTLTTTARRGRRTPDPLPVPNHARDHGRSSRAH